MGLRAFTYLRDGIRNFYRYILDLRFEGLPNQENLKQFVYDKNLDTEVLDFVYMVNLVRNEQYTSLG